jgi:hypothetical protein
MNRWNETRLGESTKWRYRSGFPSESGGGGALGGPNFLSKFKAILIFRGPASIITAPFANNSIKQCKLARHAA